MDSCGPRFMPVANPGSPQHPMQDGKPTSSLLSGIFGRKPKSSIPSLTPTCSKTMSDISEEANFNKEMVAVLNEEMLKKTEELRMAEVERTAALQARDKQKFAKDALARYIDELQSQKDALSKQKFDLSEALAANKLELEGQIEGLEQQLIQANVDLCDQNEELADLEERVSELLGEKETLEAYLTFEQTTNKDLQKQLVTIGDELDFTKDCNATMKRSLRAAEARVENLKEQLAAQQATSQKSSDTAVIEALQQQLKEWADYAAHCQQEIEKRDRILANFENATEKGQLMLIQLDSSRNELAARNKTSDERARILEYENQELAHQVQDGQHELATQAMTNKHLEEKLATAEQDCIDQRNEASRKARDVFTKHKAGYKRHKDAIRDKDGKIQGLERRLETAINDGSAAEATLKAEITRLQDDLQRKKLDLEDELAKNASTWEWMQEKGKENAQLHETNQALMDRVSKLEQEQQALCQTIKDLMQQNLEQTTKNQDLKKAISVSGDKLLAEREEKTSRNVEHKKEKSILQNSFDDLSVHCSKVEEDLYSREVQIAELLGQNNFLSGIIAQNNALAASREQHYAQQMIQVQEHVEELPAEGTPVHECDVWVQVADEPANLVSVP